MDVGSDDQNILGNELPSGVITCAQGLTGITQDGNTTRDGIVWTEPDEHLIPDSLYRCVRPGFFPANDPQMPWPPIGPESPCFSGMIPAQVRYVSGVRIPAE